MICNPFTGMVLNADIPNPKGCNQHTGPDCGGSSVDVKKLEQVRHLTEALQKMQRKKRYSLEGSYQNLRDEVGGRIEFGAEDLKPRSNWKHAAEGRMSYSYDPTSESPRKESPEIKIGSGLFDREVAAHEIGHVKTPFHIDADEVLSRRNIYEEGGAWDWALKNAKRLGLSKRKLKRVSKAALATYEKRFLDED